MPQDTTQIIRKALLGLLRHRDFLGDQLSYAQGYFDEETMALSRNDYFSAMTTPSREEIIEFAKVLRALIPEGLSADVLSCAVHCDFTVALEALRELRSLESR